MRPLSGSAAGLCRTGQIHHQAFAAEEGGLDAAHGPDIETHVIAKGDQMASINGVSLAGSQVQLVDSAIGRQEGFTHAGDLQHNQTFGGEEGFCTTPFGIHIDAIFRSNV